MLPFCLVDDDDDGRRKATARSISQTTFDLTTHSNHKVGKATHNNTELLTCVCVCHNSSEETEKFTTQTQKQKKIMFQATKIPCCLCGQMILPNEANQCTTCLAQQFDLRQVLQGKNGEPHIIHQCRQCRRFARTESVYEPCDFESPELLSICLKQIPALITSKNGATASKIHIVDAIWVWTEPHSMRLKIRLTIRTEMMAVQIQQRVLVEYHIHWKMCDNCNRQYTNRTWQALVQLRQKRDIGATRRGLAAMEMALRRNKDLRSKVLKIDACKNGLDFYFLTLPQAQSFAQFLAKLAPMKIKTTQKLVSTDVKSNTANIKYTLTCDVVPLTRDDLIIVHKHTHGKLSGKLGLVIKQSSQVHIIDASPTRQGGAMDILELSSEAYHKAGGDKGYTTLQTPERMVRFVVLDVELCDADDTVTNDHDVYEGPASGVEKYAMADVLVARESDMGSNDLTYSVVSHMGHLIQPGDIVLGYDLESTSGGGLSVSSSTGIVDVEEIINSNVVLPDVVLVKKVKGGGGKADEDEATKDLQDGDDEVQLNGKKKRISKKKLRRQKKQDKKQRELEETAERMGFLDDFNEDYGDEDDFDKVLENDPQLAAEVDAMEKQFETFQDEVVGNDDHENDDQTQNNVATVDNLASSKQEGVD